MVFIDDDITLEEDWLERIVPEFEEGRVWGVGGRVIASEMDTLAQRYLDAVGYGSPATPGRRFGAGPVGRFLTYLSTNVNPAADVRQAVAVAALGGACVAYRRNRLLAVGGFDRSVATGEDTDAAVRLTDGGGTLMYVPSAVARHHHARRVVGLLKECYVRSRGELALYRKQGRMPAVFPLPGVVLLLCVRKVDKGVKTSALAALGWPLAIYPWWVLRAIKTKRPEMLAYAHIQATMEGASTLGTLAGMYQSRTWRRS
ncbi:hypothetical protein acdb102_19480 [Acidothermaceae bacterium B102]|nr:hypothetical protein acdb102_19480 [Acidothermaceae bacterium B102]